MMTRYGMVGADLRRGQNHTSSRVSLEKAWGIVLCVLMLYPHLQSNLSIASAACSPHVVLCSCMLGSCGLHIMMTSIVISDGIRNDGIKGSYFALPRRCHKQPFDDKRCVCCSYSFFICLCMNYQGLDTISLRLSFHGCTSSFPANRRPRCAQFRRMLLTPTQIIPLNMPTKIFL